MRITLMLAVLALVAVLMHWRILGWAIFLFIAGCAMYGITETVADLLRPQRRRR